MTLATQPRGGSIVELVPSAGADPAKLLTAYVSPAKDITILGLDTDGGIDPDDLERSRLVQRRRPSTEHVLPAPRLERRRHAAASSTSGFLTTSHVRSGRVLGTARLRLRADQHTDHGAPPMSETSADRRARRLTRSQLLRRAGGAAAAVAVGGAAPSYAFAGPLRYTGRWLAGDLSVVQWSHFVPRYDALVQDVGRRLG